ncbi:MAG: succinylglutamate desuccinylase/aspartoacylase family protein [Bacteroides sp.]|nr:succinylglutamate desuccinylase/aspartoacylase family protein [Bacteroides sp.]
MKTRLLTCLLALCSSLVLYAQPTSVLQRGEGTFTYNSYLPFANRPVDVHYYIPSQGDIQQMPIIFVFEGGDRGFRYLMDGWKEEAEQKQFMLFIPHFDLKSYPLADYQEVGVMNPQHTEVHAPERLTPALVDKLFEYIQQQSDSQQKGYMIYGHSAGGQFVQRFMLFHESPYVQKAIIGCPGWYTFPDINQQFPYGVGDIPYITSERIRKYLETPIILQLGTADTVRESYLRKTPEAEWQGRNRLERGRKFYHFLHQLAQEKGWKCNWRLIEEEGVGHIAVPMGQRAVPALLQDSIRVLFLGNSYTFFNSMIRQVQSLATSCGKKLSVKEVAHGGWRLRQHAADSISIKAIQEGDWDFMVMQEQSKEPTHDRDFIEKNIFPATEKLDSLRRLYAPQGKSVFYMTWGRNNETFDDMQQKLAATYLEMARRQNALCAPVGIAWKRVRTERPDLQLYDPDQSHPTRIGSYLTACVFYTLFFDEAYSSNYYDGLSEVDARYLQRVAQEVVLSNRMLWNLTTSTQPQSVTDRFYPNPQRAYHSPTLCKPKEEGIASLYDINQYLQQLADNHPQQMQLESLGRTPQGREIPIVYLGQQNKKKADIWIQAGLHGNEPAGTDAICILADYLLNTAEGNELLNKVSLTLVPVANPDGYALQQRRSGSGYDLNRDQSKLADPVTQLLKQAYTARCPEVALDIHEYTPLRREFKAINGNRIATAADVLFLPSGHLNIPENLRRLSNGLFRQEAEQVLEEQGYHSAFYFTPKVINDTLYAVKDAKSPQSSSTFQALGNAVSLFIEIRGIGLGQTNFARRSEAGFLVARSILQTAATHSKEIKQEVRKAIKNTQKGKEYIYVTFESSHNRLPITFVDYDRCERFTQEFPTLDALLLQPTLIRKRPKAYILSAGCKLAVEKLRMLGIEVQQLQKLQKVTVEKYLVTNLKRNEKWEQIEPVTVSTRTSTADEIIPAGSYLVPLTQRQGNLIATLLEPESANGFVNFCIIGAENGKELPIFRLIK